MWRLEHFISCNSSKKLLHAEVNSAFGEIKELNLVLNLSLQLTLYFIEAFLPCILKELCAKYS